MDKNLEYEPVRGAHILMIVNPVSGRIGGEHTADKLEAWLKENGAAVDRFETTETENGSGYTAKLAENDYARVVVLGGDGTLNAVLNGMLHRALRTPITYLPAGTTNDFAQTLGIQKHLLDPYKSFTETEDRLIDAGKFDWMAHADKFPGLCTPDDSYHGVTYAEKFGKEGAFITKCTSQLMRDLGCAQSPQSAFILNLGLESLHVRMPRHVENGQAVAEFLEKHDKVEFVNYPTLPSNKYYETAKKYLPNGGCGVVSFELKGGRAAAEKFMKNLKLAAIETHVADARTCCLNPATSTHRQMNDEQLAAAGIPAGLIRISCGLEDKNDLIADIAQALDAI